MEFPIDALENATKKKRAESVAERKRACTELIRQAPEYNSYLPYIFMQPIATAASDRVPLASPR